MKKGIVLVAALLSGIGVGGFFMFRAHSPSRTALLLSPSLSNPKPTTFYRWRDPQGRLQLSSEKPPAGVTYENVTVDGTLSRMDPPPEPAPESAAPSGQPNPLMVYSPTGAQQLVKDAQNAAQLARDQQRQLEQQMRNSGAVPK